MASSTEPLHAILDAQLISSWIPVYILLCRQDAYAFEGAAKLLLLVLLYIL